jgi:hypothetical protein
MITSYAGEIQVQTMVMNNHACRKYEKKGKKL